MAKFMFARLLSTHGFSLRARNALNKDIGKVIPVIGNMEGVECRGAPGSFGFTQHHRHSGNFENWTTHYELLHD